MRSGPYYGSMPSNPVTQTRAPAPPNVGSSPAGVSSVAEASQAPPAVATMPTSNVPASSSTPVSSTAESSQVSGSAAASKVPPPAAAAATANTSQQQVSRSIAPAASEKSHSSSRSERVGRRTFIIRPTIVNLATGHKHAPAIPTHTFLSTSISLLLYLGVMIIIFSVDCPLDRDVVQFFAFVLLAFTGCLFILIINLTAVKYHRLNWVATSLSLLYSGSAALVVFGLVDSSVHGLCKPDKTPAGTIFKSGVSHNYFMWVMTSLSVLWQLIAYYYYG